MFAVPGGVNKSLKAEERDYILKGVDDAIEATQIGLTIMKDWAAKNAEDINKFAVLTSGYFGLVTPNNGLELYDGDMRLIDRAGKQLEKFDGRNYLDYIAEHVEDWSYLKFPYYKKLGWPERRVSRGAAGPLQCVGHDRDAAGECRTADCSRRWATASRSSTRCTITTRG